MIKVGRGTIAILIAVISIVTLAARMRFGRATKTVLRAPPSPFQQWNPLSSLNRWFWWGQWRWVEPVVVVELVVAQMTEDRPIGGGVTDCTNTESSSSSWWQKRLSFSV